MSQNLTLDQKKIESLAFRVVGDLGGTFAMAMAYVGDKLGIFKAMAGAGPLTSMELAQKTKLNERYVREWLKNMVASEYLDYDPAANKYIMTEEQAFVLTNEDSPMFVGGGLQMSMPTVLNIPKIIQAFQKGGGIPFNELGEEIQLGTERFFRPGYINFLVNDWLAAVPGLVAKLQTGGTVLDVGCGCGQSSVVMAKAFPKAQITGLDNDSLSIQRAKKLAAQHNLKNVTFLQKSAHEIPQGQTYDLICSFDCIHDMVDPRGTLKAIRAALAHDGVYFWSEPNASSNPLENRNPVGKTFSGISPLHCLTVSLAHQGEGLGTIIGESGARQLAKEAGFTKFEKVPINNPFNQFFALRK